jgi:hypothetical protein
LGILPSAPCVASGGEVPGICDALIPGSATQATNYIVLVPGAGA